MTKPQSSTRMTARRRKRTAVMRRSALVALEDERGRADLEAVAGVEGVAGRGRLVDAHAVGGPEVDEDEFVAVEADLRVLAGDTGIVEPKVGLGGASEHGDAVGEEERLLLAARLRCAIRCLAPGGDDQPRVTG